MAEVSNFLENITDPMAIIVRVCGLMAACFWFLWEFLGFIFFLARLVRINMDASKEPPISNSKILKQPLYLCSFFQFDLMMHSMRLLTTLSAPSHGHLLTFHSSALDFTTSVIDYSHGTTCIPTYTELGRNNLKFSNVKWNGWHGLWTNRSNQESVKH